MQNLNLEIFGFDCHRVETRDGSIVYQIETPFSLAEEHSFCIFSETVGTNLRLFDEGNTIFDLRGFGVNFEGKSNLYKSLRSTLKKWGLDITSGTCIEAYAPIEKAPALLSGYIAAMMELEAWIRNNLSIRPSKTNLVAQTALFMKSWLGEGAYEEKPTLKGKFGEKLVFDMGFDRVLVDSLFPNSNSSANFMRKAAATKFVSDKKTLAVVDDSQNPVKAAQEVELIGAVSHAITLGNLALNASSQSSTRPRFCN